MPALTTVTSVDGKFKLPFNHTDIAKLSVTDVDLVVELKNGQHVVLLHGALDAMAELPSNVSFADGTTLLTSELLNQVSEFGVAAVDSPLTVPNVSPAPTEPTKQASPEEQQASQTPETEEQTPPTPSAAPAPPSPTDATSEALKDVSAHTARPMIILPPQEAEPPHIVRPPSPSGSVQVPVIVRSTPPAEIKELSLFNVTGVREDGASLYGAGGDPSTATDSTLAAQSAAEHIVGTSGNDVIHGDDSQRLGAGFAKVMQLSVGNIGKVDSYSISGLPSGFSFEGGSVDANGVWHLNVPTAQAGASFNGTYDISNKLLYPTNLATDSTGFAQSFVFTISLSVTDLSGHTSQFNKTVTVIVKDVNTATDLLVSSPVTDYTLVLPARGLSNFIEAGAGDDTLYGGAANDTLDGGTGVDTMFGGDGNDTYVADNVADIVTEAAHEGTDLVLASVSFTLSSNVENLTFTGASAGLTATGNELNNVLTANNTGSILRGMAGNDILNGGAWDDILDGGTGADVMAGGQGNDTYVVDNTGDMVSEESGAGTDLVLSNISYTLTSNIENITLIGTTAGLVGNGNALSNVLTANDYGSHLFGMEGNDMLLGGAGDDTLDGGTGRDVMTGGMGNDTYIVDDVGDTVSEAANAGTDTVVSSIGYVLAIGNNVENLTLTGTDDLNGTGNELDNILTGNSGANLLLGGAGNDTLYGGAGNDTLDGGAGADRMMGGTGNDTYIVDDTGDIITEGAGEGTDSVLANVSYALSANVENLTLTGSADLHGSGNELDNVLVGNSGDNILWGGAGNDTLVGGAGNDTLDGGTGIDVMSGGLGDDTYRVDDSRDTVNESAGEGNDLVLATVTYTLSDNVENLTLIGSAGALIATGNAMDNTLIANDAGNTLAGLAGDDILIGGAGSDTLDGGAGVDTMTGGLGNDTYYVDDMGDSVIETAGEGTDTVVASIDYIIASGSNVENLTLSGSADLNGTGNEQDNILTGNEGANVLSGGAGNDTLIGGGGNDTLDGGLGADTMSGGAGDDTYYVDNAGDVVSESLGDGTDLVLASVSCTLSSFVENLTLTSTTANLSATGNTLDNVLTANSAGSMLYGLEGRDTLIGGAGADILDGGSGADTMSGGAGNDTYYVDDAGDVITELANEGTDLVYSTVTATLFANVENMTLTGTNANLTATGNNLDNVLIANNAGSTLMGMAGNDTLTGGAGNDILDGGTGNDLMSGGAGNDIYYVDNASDVVSEAASAGTDLVYSTVTYTLAANVENMTLTGTTANLTATGNSLDNMLIANNAGSTLMGMAGNDTLTGGIGNDTLDGGVGNDIMAGGAGNDIYVVDSVNDVVKENAGEGVDTVRASIAYTLGANVENLTLTGSTTGLVGTGNSMDNVLTASNAGNTLRGMDGNDTLVGGSGNDTLDGGSGADSMTGGAGNDMYYVDDIGDVVTEAAGQGTDLIYSSISYRLTLGGNVENLTLTGSSDNNGTGNEHDNTLIGNIGNNTLIGGGGNDILDGGIGADIMDGGMGNDTYYVDNLGDVVREFANAGIDLVNSSIDYVLTLGSNIENLTLTGTTAINGTGNALDNILTGNSIANTLIGGAGNDTLDGRAGADTLIGGVGDDTYYVNNVGDAVIENAGEGRDTVMASLSHILEGSVENLTLTGTAAGLTATGNALDNTITANSGASLLFGLNGNDTLIGGAGNDVLDGGTGADSMAGGLGNDTYYVDGMGDTVTEAIGEGTDLVHTSVDYTLGVNVENGAIAGNSAARTLTGNAQNNTLTASSYADTLNGGAGDDTLILNNSNYLSARADGGAGNDMLQINGLMGGSLVNLSNLTGRISNVEAINIKDGASEFISVSASAIQSIVGQGANSSLTIHLDATDSIVVQAGSFYTANAGGSVYTFYNSDPAAGGAQQIAQINVSTA